MTLVLPCSNREHDREVVKGAVLKTEGRRTARGRQCHEDRKVKRCLSHERQQNRERKAVPHSLTCSSDAVQSWQALEQACVFCSGLVSLGQEGAPREQQISRLSASASHKTRPVSIVRHHSTDGRV